MTKYVKSDIVDRPYFTAGKVYEVDFLGTSIVKIIRDDNYGEWVHPDNCFGRTCKHLDNKDTWKWCDKEGNEL